MLTAQPAEFPPCDLCRCFAAVFVKFDELVAAVAKREKPCGGLVAHQDPLGVIAVVDALSVLLAGNAFTAVALENLPPETRPLRRSQIVLVRGVAGVFEPPIPATVDLEKLRRSFRHSGDDFRSSRAR